MDSPGNPRATSREDLNLIEENFGALRELLAPDKHKWESLGDSDGVRLSRLKLEKSDIFISRGDAVFPFPADVIVAAISDHDNRSKWDELFVSRTTLRPIYDRGLGQRAFIGHLKFKAPGFLVSPRDFVALMASTFNAGDGTGAFCSRSVIDKNMGEQSGYVRGEILTSGYTLSPAEGGKGTKVTYVVQARDAMLRGLQIDPKGWIPTGVVNSVGRQQGLSLAKLRNYIEKQQKR